MNGKKSDIKNISAKKSEIKAIITLQYFFPKFKKFSIKDRIKENTENPDWQCSNLNIGVEVTVAYSRIQLQLNLVVLNTFGKGNTPAQVNNFIINKKINKELQNKILVYDCAGTSVLSTEDGVQNIYDEIETIKHRIDEKNNKFKNYVRFKENDLYIFCSYLLNDDDIENIMKNQDCYFDNIYFDFEHQVVKYNVISHKKDIIEITKETAKKISRDLNDYMKEYE